MPERNQFERPTGSQSHFHVSSSIKESMSAVRGTFPIRSAAPEPSATQREKSATVIPGQSTPSQINLSENHQPGADHILDTATNLQGLMSCPSSTSVMIPVTIEIEVSEEVDCLQDTYLEEMHHPAEQRRRICTPSTATSTQSNEGYSPMERYLNEGPKERYSLFCVQSHGVRLLPRTENISPGDCEVTFANGNGSRMQGRE